MQTSGNRSSFYRPATRRSTRVAGVGMAVGFMFAVAGLGACSPGSLPGDFQVPGVTPATGGTSGGNTGGAPGPAAGGSVGSMGGSGGMPSAGGAVSPSTPVANCTKFSTLGDADGFFKMRCGVASNCHGASAPWTEMSGTNLFMSLLDAKPKFDCTSDKIINSGDYMKSLLVAKTSQMAPACPTGGTSAMALMPPANMMPMMAPLNPDEVTCIQQFAKAASGH
jgi:hypothetical protein